MARAPKMAWPTRTTVAPSSMATSKSPDMPMDSSSRPTPAGASWRKRSIGLLAGLPLLYIVNVVRLVCLAFIGAYAENTEVFEFAHQYVWQTLYILIVVGVWLLWVELVVRPGAVWGKKQTSGG